MTSFKHILVPTDFGPAADRALDIALELAKRFDAKVTLLHSTWLPALPVLTVAASSIPAIRDETLAELSVGQ